MKVNDAMINIVSSDKLVKICEFQKCLILVTDNFEGHRIDWLKEFIHKVEEHGLKLIVITFDLHRINTEYYEKDSRTIFCCDFSSRSEVISYINANFEIGQTVAFWDSDLWIKELFKLRHRSQLLFMRPYISNLSFRPAVNFVLKIMAMCYLKYVRGHSLGLLSVPLNRRLLFNKDQVSDELILGKFYFAPNSQNSDQPTYPFPKKLLTIVVPGFISMRKNPFLVVEVGKNLASTTDLIFRIVFLGKIDEEIKRVLESYSFDWLSVNDKYLKIEDFLHNINESSVILLPYSNRGSSGIVLQAQYLGKPVIVSKNRLWAKVANSSDANIILAKMSVGSIKDSILKVCANPELSFKSSKVFCGQVSAFTFLMGRRNLRN